jgi:hypothetical protein
MVAISRKKISKGLSKRFNRFLMSRTSSAGSEQEMPSSPVLKSGKSMASTPPSTPLQEPTQTADISASSSPPIIEQASLPEAVVASDTSDSDSSSEEEQEDAGKYDYGETTHPSEELVAAALRNSSGRSRRSSCVTKVVPVAAPVVPALPNSTASSSTPTKQQQGEAEGAETPPQVAFRPERTPPSSALKGARFRRRRASIGTCTSEEFTKASSNSNPNGPDTRAVIEVKLPGVKGKVRRRRSITFNEEVNVRKVVPTKLLSEEPEKLWFQSQEYSVIKKKTQALLSRVDANGFVDGKKYCTRGLERYMLSHEDREGKKYGALDSVLLEQRLQRGEGVFDADSIARFYKQTSSKCAQDAAMLAIKDAEEVASFYTEGPLFAQVDRPEARLVRRRASMA